MHKPVHAKNGNLMHSNECRMAFGRKDPECPRCIELLNGAPSRDGWQKSYFDHQKKRDQEDLIRVQELIIHTKSHKHLNGECGMCCTFGDY